MNDTIVTFEGYLAEMIELQASRRNLSPEDYILSFFVRGCNAPTQNKVIFYPEGCNAPSRD